MLLPRDVPCPHCGARTDHGCHSAPRPIVPTRTHLARWQAVGVKRPTGEQRDMDERDGAERDAKFRKEFFASFRAGKKDRAQWH